ncbi:predicted protein [Chaetoceros tenuissimus]|uniref:DUF6824 domain-containing protein n=1 Tax=Chaetoceros tenuissimus TaxID=426638 RepID=A0AAD3D246_9STRA|nr:predicted protein [Chaetoceros tenuissimus]
MIEPRENDILKGRGVYSYNHKGNVHFRKLILENSDRYNQCSNRREKSSIISSIYATITSGYGGRFLEASDTKSGSSDESYRESWRVVDETEAKKKISQSLRDEKKRQQRSTDTCVTEEDASSLSRRRKRPRLLTESREQSSMQTMTTGTTSSSSQGEQTSYSTSPVLPSNVSAPPLHAAAAAAAPLVNSNFLTLPPLSAAAISDALSGMSTMSGFSNSNTSAMGSNNIQNILPLSLHSSLNNFCYNNGHAGSAATAQQLSDLSTLQYFVAPRSISATSSNSRNSQVEALSFSHLSTTNPLQTTEQLISQFRRDHPSISDANTITSSSKASFSASDLLNSLASAAPSTTSSSNNSSSNLDSKDSSNNVATTTTKSNGMNGMRPSSASEMSAKEIEDCLNFRNPDTSALDFDTIFEPL